MAKNKNDDLNSITLNILDDQALDKICPWLETNTGKMRRQIENTIIQVNISLYEYFVLSAIQFYLDKAKQENILLKEKMIEKNIQEEKEKIFYQHLYSENLFMEAKRLGLMLELAKIKEILVETINQLNIQIIRLERLISEKEKEIHELDKQYKQNNDELRNIYIEHYTNIITNPIEPIPLPNIPKDLASELGLPEDHAFAPYDPTPIAHRLNKQVQDPNYNMDDHDRIAEEEYEKDITHHVKTQLASKLPNAPSSDENNHIIEKHNKAIGEKASVTLMAVLAATRLENPIKKRVVQLKKDQDAIHKEKRIKSLEKSQAETQLQKTIDDKNLQLKTLENTNSFESQTLQLEPSNNNILSNQIIITVESSTTKSIQFNSSISVSTTPGTMFKANIEPSQQPEEKQSMDKKNNITNTWDDMP